MSATIDTRPPEHKSAKKLSRKPAAADAMPGYHCDDCSQNKLPYRWPMKGTPKKEYGMLKQPPNPSPTSAAIANNVLSS